jgi:hypothetical protein
MRMPRISAEIIMLGTTVACAIALLIVILGTIASLAAEAFGQTQTKPEQTYEGMITCSRCGARHSAKIGASAAKCTWICVVGGSDLALVDGDKVYALDVKASTMRNVVGQRVRITGVVAENKLHVTSVLQTDSQ